MNQTLEQPRTADAGRSAWWLRLIAGLPFGVLYALAGVAAFLMRYVLRIRVGVVRDNLRGCFPQLCSREINALRDAYYRQLGQVAVEFFKLASLSVDELRSRVRVVNFEPVQAETRAGRSVLLLAAHHCNWEWALQRTTVQLEVPLDAAYKPLHAAGADRELRKLRCRFGARLIAAKKLVREVARRRHELHAVALMADQMPASSGGRFWLRFLGRDTAFYPGPAEIARLTGYAAFFVAMRRTGRGRYELDYQPLCAALERLDPQLFTERYARAVEQEILAQPANWTWMHRRWKSAPPLALSPGGSQAGGGHLLS
jgi:KDO2-lipid IV(A) lauroyltransferase